jgi:hypothetical protein
MINDHIFFFFTQAGTPPTQRIVFDSQVIFPGPVQETVREVRIEAALAVWWHPVAL